MILPLFRDFAIIIASVHSLFHNSQVPIFRSLCLIDQFSSTFSIFISLKKVPGHTWSPFVHYCPFRPCCAPIFVYVHYHVVAQIDYVPVLNKKQKKKGYSMPTCARCLTKSLSIIKNLISFVSSVSNVLNVFILKIQVSRALDS